MRSRLWINNLFNFTREEFRDPELALVYARRTVDREPGLAWNHFTLGRCLETTGDPEAALVAFEEATRLAPRDGFFPNQLARRLARNADTRPEMTTRAVVAARKAVSITPDDPNLLTTLRMALYRLGSFEEAIETIRSSVQLNGGQIDALNKFVLAMAHHRLGHHKEAKDSYDRSIAWMNSQDRDDPELIIVRAEAEALLQSSSLAPSISVELIAPTILASP